MTNEIAVYVSRAVIWSLVPILAICGFLGRRLLQAIDNLAAAVHQLQLTEAANNVKITTLTARVAELSTAVRKIP